MKLLKLLLLFLVGAFAISSASGQANAYINILTQNGGQVGLGGTGNIEVTVGNTGPVSSIGVNKVRAQISVPSALVSVLPNAQQTGLPPGWSITVNTGSAITVCNGTDVIPVGAARTILIKVQGNNLGGPSTVNGNLLFSSGTSCTAPGSLPGDNTADNSSTTSIEVVNAPACNLALTSAAGNIACNGGTTILTATATGANGAVEYSLNGGAFQPGNTFTVGAGTYTVTAREAANTTCTATAAAVTVNQPAALIASASSTPVTTIGGSNGTATATVSGGTTTYTYLWAPGGQTTATATGLTAGTYTVTVTDANGCTTTASTTVGSPVCNVTLSFANTNVFCFGGSTGTATVTAANTTGTVTYLWSNGQTTATATGLAAGTFSVTVTDGAGCTATGSVTISQPAAALAVSASSTPVTTIGGTNGTATATATGGTAPYTYSWAPGGQTTATATGLTAGAYTVTVTDANGCTATASTTVGSPACNITVSIAKTNVLCFGGSTGTATVTAANTTGTVTYLWSNGQTTATATGLAAGTYSVTVTDGAGCTATGSVTISQPAAALAVSASSTPVTTIGGSNGTATATATGGTAPYTYSWAPGGQTTATATGLTAGAYTVTVTDANGCTATASTTVGSPACNITVSIAKTNVLCFGGSTGTATATAANTTGTVTYLWSNGQTTATATGLAAGTYSVTVTDGAGCTATGSVTITQPAAALAVSASSTPVTTIGGSNGTATATVSGGTSPYLYSWAPGGQTTATATGLTAGAYTVTVTDANGCTATASTTVGSPVCSITVTASAGTILCNGGTTTLTATATGANGAVEYSLNGGAFQAGNSFTVGAGTYTVIAREAGNTSCTATATAVTVNQPAAITVSASAVAITCNGGTTTLTVIASGGTGTLQYSINNGPPFQTSNTFTVGAGNFTVTVKDANNCTAQTSLTIAQPVALVATSTAPPIVVVGGTTTVTVSATGGTAPYTGTGTFVRSAGTYNFTVTDANGCTANTSITLTNPLANAYINVLTQNNGQVNLGGIVDIEVTVGNTGPTGAIGPNKVRAQLSVPVAIATLLPNAQQTGLPAGWTILTNAGGAITICNGTDVIPVGSNRTLLIKVQGAAIGGPSTVTGNLSFGPGTGVCTGPGSLSGDNTADNSSTSTIQVVSGCNLSVTAVAGNIACNGGTTTLTATASGANGAVEYSINGGTTFQTANTFTVNAAGSPYTITAREVNNTSCTATSAAVSVNQPTQLVASESHTAILCNGGTSSVIISATGGTAPYTGTGAFAQPAGTQSYTVTDANGCTSSVSITVSQPTVLAATASSTPVTTIGGSDGTATVTATGGTAPYTYLWAPGGQTTATATGLTAGAYTVTVTDANGCTATASTSVGSPACNITATAAAGTITCTGGTTTLTVTTTGGVAPLQYSLNGGAFQAGNTFTVSAGSYTVTVKDAGNCTATTNTVIVTVALDNINPTITAPANVSACTNSGCTATGVLLGSPVTADNCSVASVTNNAPAAFPLGTTTVTWTVTDGSGNTATATQTVTVTDCTAPTIYVNASGLSLPGITGQSSSASPYVLPLKPGVKFKSILSVGDAPGGYAMVGIPDGLGAFDNNDGTFTLLMNHELGNTVGGVRAHGAIGAFVSKWVINKTNLQVISGSDLMQQVYNWNTGTQSSNTTTSTFAFNRFCSADLPPVSAFYNGATGLGTKARIFMHGEEGGATGYQLGSVANGPDAGKAYILGKFNLTTNGSGLTGVGAWENALANPFEQNKTIVIGNNDGGTGIMTNSVSVYVGTKTNTGTEVDKAGLTNGTLSFVNVTGNPVEIVNTTTRATNIVSGTPFTLSSTSSTTFSRPEDGVWNPANPAQYFFVTTDQYDQVKDGVGAQVGRSRLWRLNFADIANPALGGTIDLLIDGTQPHNMFDNVAADKCGHLILQEDVGNQQHNGKIYQYTLPSGPLVQLAKHDPARFGDVGQPATAPFNQDEETSGIIDVSDILGKGWFLTSDQAHNALANPLVEGGQLMAMFNPESVCATATAQDTLRVCSGTGVNLGTPATADNCSVASVTNNAPAVFPVGTTTVTWTVTDGSGNTATATQVVIVSNLAVTATTTAVTTPGGNDGTATAVVTGGTAPYTYSWAPGGQTTATATGLTAGTYTVTVTDEAGCVKTATVTVTSPTCNVTLAFTQTNVLCFGSATGTATVTAVNTSGTVSYSWNTVPVQTTATATGLTAGTYTVTVTDGSGCTATGSVTITQPTQLVAASTATAILCNGGSSIVTVSATGGTAPYTGTGTFNRTAGTYSFTITDANGCTAVTTITIAQPAVLVAASTATAILCNGGSSTVTVSATGGTAPYTGTGTFSRTAGTYSFTVTDAKGCTAVTTVTIAQPTALVAASTASAILCNGGSSTVTVSATGGTAPYTGTGSFSRTAGTYSFTVTDANGCTAVTSITITQPTALAVTATATAATSGANGTATANASGGTAPYTYLWAPGGQTTQTATGLAAGTYTVTVTDAKGCTKTATATVTAGGCTLVVNAGPNEVLCSIALLTANVTGVSTLPGNSNCHVSYVWKKNGSIVGTSKSILVFSTGTYVVTATDCKGCTSTDEVVVSASTLAATATAGTISCYGGTTTVTVTATGGTAPYYGTGTFTKQAGTYTFFVLDSKGCIVTTDITITQPTQLVVTATAPQIACGATTANVTVSATGGTAPYTGTGTFVRTAGTYTFTVTDSKGCTASKSVTVTSASCGPVDPNKCYNIVNRNSGKLLSIEGCSLNNDKKALQQTTSSCAIWKFTEVTNGFYKITNVNSGKVLDVSGGSTAENANIIQYNFSGDNNQKWSLTASGAYFVLKAKHSGKAMSVKNASTNNGAEVVQKGTGSNTNEQWSIVEVGCPGIMTFANPETQPEPEEYLDLSVSPNPSTSYFNLSIKSSDNSTPINVRILDVNGVVKSVYPNVQVIKTGMLRLEAQQWPSGTYLAEVIQGDIRKTVKLIKLN